MSPTAGQQLEAHRHPSHARVAEEERIQRPDERRRHAQGDEGVHRGRAMAKVGPRGTVERPGTPDHDRGGQGQRQPLPVGELQCRDHRHQHDRDGQDSGDDQPLPQGRQLRGFRFTVGGVLVGSSRRFGQGGGVAGCLDGRDQVLGGGRGPAHVRVDMYSGGLQRVVDLGGHTRHPVQLLLHPGRTGRACHSPDGEVHHLVMDRHVGGHRSSFVVCDRSTKRTQQWFSRGSGKSGARR